jgi:predicted nucleic acid-binding Zn ribbon protein
VPDRGADDKIRLAREALAAAKAEARARGLQPTRRARLRAATEGDSSSSDTRLPDPDVGSQTQAVAGEPTERGTAQDRRPGGSGRTYGPGLAVPPQRADPQPLSRAMDNLIANEGWTLAAATGSVFGRWAQIVGPDLAGHTTPESLTNGELTVSADSTAWATQLRLLAGQLVRRLNAELGEGTVQRVKVRGPATGWRKPGEWRVRGGRGPRDTYG